MREWNAETYHRVSDPQFDWGTVVLARLPLEGCECVLDVGCGTGRLTERLLERLPRGRVVGIDQSSNMVRVAREYLQRNDRRIQLLVADASVFPDAETYRTFITNVICRPHLAHLPDAPSRDAFIDELTRQAAADEPQFELDYWRLNIEARRSG